MPLKAMKFRRPVILTWLAFAVFLAIAPRMALADAAADAIVRESDTARGGGLPGISWDIHIVTTGNNDATDGERDMSVKAIQTSSLAETLTPVRFRGTKLLQVDHNMWLSRPGLQKAIPISPRQRLSGLAANGDIAATNYAADYSAELLRDEAVGAEMCHVLKLTARSRYSTYDGINYWVSIDRKVAVKADFLAVSGKLLKTATFEYKNAIQVGDRSVPFISRMVISDGLTPAQTAMDYSDVAVRTIPTSTFESGNL